MTIYQNSDQLYKALQTLFGRMENENPEAAQSVVKAHMIIRLRTTAPEAEIVFNGRRNPVKITYGPSPLRPDLDVGLTADALHYILLAELPLSKALSSNQMKVRGPVWKAFVLEDIFHQGQELYPQILGRVFGENNGVS